MCKYAPNASLSDLVLTAKRRMLNFSPIVEIASFIFSSTVLPSSNLVSINASTDSALVASTWLAISFTKFWKPSLRATKSVSELISTIAASLPLISTCTRPSAAIRSAFLAALAIPFSRK
ncbi:Uncharacterised protein [Streptococcus pneumoniae]|nr:Uncharacterised protein [Streptococcus pneumoniae]